MTDPGAPRPWWDLLPEETVYRDAGCDLSPSCLSCALERCAEDQPRGRQRVRQRSMSATVGSLLDMGYTQAQIASMLGVSDRTVGRYKNLYPSRDNGDETQEPSPAPDKKGGNQC